MFCETCQSWELTEADLYCSWCGATLIDVEVVLSKPYLYAGGADDILVLTISHTGAFGTIKVDRVGSDQPWLRVDDEEIARRLPGRVLRPGAQLLVPVVAEVGGLSEYSVATISVASDVGERKATLEAVPTPTFEKVSTGGTHKILLDEVYDEKLTGYLGISGGILTVEKLQADVDWATVVPTNQPPLPFSLDWRNNRRLEFEIKVDERLLKQQIKTSGGKYPVSREGNIVAKFAHLDVESKWPFYVECFQPPELIIPQEQPRIELPIFLGRSRQLSLTLQNGGERGETGRSELQILEIVPDVPWLKPVAPIPFPITIPSGQYQQITFVVNADEVGEGSYHAEITFVTNTPGHNKTHKTYVEVDVSQMPEFRGVLAIDFGTTNSCCAFVDESGRAGMIEVDDEPSIKGRTTASSTILYQNLLDSGDKFYEIGSRAYSISFELPAANSTVKQAKRRLGRTEPFDITFLSDRSKHARYQAREVTADILRRILKHAEEQLGRRITSCTISHPSRFSLRQINDLKAALTSCGIENISTVHEPVGAALEFIQRDDVLKNYRDYNLMVYDFGGGTTDVTLLHVENMPRLNQQITDIMPTVLGATGDPSFGGEDVTEMILEFAHGKCEQILRERYRDANSCLVPIEPRIFTNDVRGRYAAQMNRNKFRVWAENTKIAIATYRDEHVSALNANPMIDGIDVRSAIDGKLVRLDVILDSELKPASESFSHEHVAPKVSELNQLLKPRIENVIRMMRRLSEHNDIESPDIILLSGKSSALPIVEHLIRDNFPQAVIEKPGDLKECVVRGACWISQDLLVTSVDIQIDQRSATTSRIGVQVPGANGDMFHEFIDAGQPIGAGGIKVRSDRVGLRNRRTRISILENTGPEDSRYINGQYNQDINEVKTFFLESKITEWERKHGRTISDAEIKGAQIELELTPDLVIRLTARIPGIEEPFEFEAEYAG